MRVLHLISSTGFYGAENVVLNLAKAFKKDGHIPYILCLKGASKPAPEIYFRALKHEILSKIVLCRHRFDIKVFNEIKKFINQENIDVVHSHGYKSNLYGLIASKISKTPIIATLHGWTEETLKVRLYEKLDRCIIRRMSHLVSVSHSITEELKMLGLNGRKVSFIPNGIDTVKFDPDKINDDLRNELCLNNNLVIGTVGRLSPEKGHIYLIKAFGDICSIVPKVKLLIVGEGLLGESLKKEARNLGIEKNVVFAGKQKDMVSIYKSMDIFVLPSLTEGLPLVLLEAMSMKLPVIATKVGGIPYVIGENEGILVSPQNTEELKNSLLFLVKDSSLRKTMGEMARQKIVSQYSIDTFYKKYTDLYSMIIKNNADN